MRVALSGVILKRVRGFHKYFVTNRGEVYSTQTGIIKQLKPGRCSFGYRFVRISNGKTIRTAKVHRLVMEAFIGPSPLHVNHKDFNKNNNTLSNLEYVTITENNRWNQMNGRGIGGEKNPKVRLDWAQVLTTYTLGNCRSTTSLAKHYSVTPENVDMLRHGKTWGFLFRKVQPTVLRKTPSTLKRDGFVAPYKKLSRTDWPRIKRLLGTLQNQKEVAKAMGVGLSTLEREIRVMKEET